MKPTTNCPEKAWKDFVSKLAEAEALKLQAPTAQIRRLHKRVRVVVQLYGVKS